MQIRKRGRRVLTSLGALVRGFPALMIVTSAVAQSTVVSPTSPVPTQPSATTLTPPSNLSPPAVNVNPQVIVGRWSQATTDKETRGTDVLTIEFMADGRYRATNRNNLLPTPEKPAQGRYSVMNVQGNAFDLRIERALADPESDPRDAVVVQRITVVDSNTLRAADGSVVRRVRE